MSNSSVRAWILIISILVSADSFGQSFSSTTTTVIPRENCVFDHDAAFFPASDTKLYIRYVCANNSISYEKGIAVIGSEGAEYFPQPDSVRFDFTVLKEINGLMMAASQYEMFSFNMSTREWSGQAVVTAIPLEEVHPVTFAYPFIDSEESFYTSLPENFDDIHNNVHAVQAMKNGALVRVKAPSNQSGAPIAVLSDGRLVWQSIKKYGDKPVICPNFSSEGKCFACQVASKYGGYAAGVVSETNTIFGTAFKDGQYFATRWEVRNNSCRLKFLQRSPLQTHPPINSEVDSMNSLGQAIGKVTTGSFDLIYWKTLSSKPISIRKKFPTLKNPTRGGFQIGMNENVSGALAYNGKKTYLKYTLLIPATSSN